MKKISIIIRVRNEAENLKILLPILKSQTEQDVEIVVVDNESTDDSQVVAESFGAEIVNISYKRFTYPKAINKGVAAARGEFLVIISAHSFPLSKDWLTQGLRHFKNPKTAGVFGPTLAYKNSSLIEKIDRLHGAIIWALRKIILPIKIRRGGMGVLGATNAMVPKRLWEKHKFNERYEAGGEDGEWANYFLKKGYDIIFDPRFAVRHVHHLRSWKDLKKQYTYWGGLGGPRKFNREELASFRKDAKRYIQQ